MAKGVTGEESREGELGSGKWTEPARSLEEVRASLSDEPVRALELGKGGGPSWRLLVVGLAVGAVLVFLGSGMLTGDTPKDPGTRTVGGQAAPVSLEATPDGGLQVTVLTEPKGARVSLDGHSYGRSPVAVPVPSDTASHELCAELGSRKACRSLTGQALAMEDPYVFPLPEKSN